jgi:hypothetical protein
MIDIPCPLIPFAQKPHGIACVTTEVRGRERQCLSKECFRLAHPAQVVEEVPPESVAPPFLSLTTVHEIRRILSKPEFHQPINGLAQNETRGRALSGLLQEGIYQELFGGMTKNALRTVPPIRIPAVAEE